MLVGGLDGSLKIACVPVWPTISRTGRSAPVSTRQLHALPTARAMADGLSVVRFVELSPLALALRFGWWSPAARYETSDAARDQCMLSCEALCTRRALARADDGHVYDAHMLQQWLRLCGSQPHVLPGMPIRSVRPVRMHSLVCTVYACTAAGGWRCARALAHAWRVLRPIVCIACTWATAGGWRCARLFAHASRVLRRTRPTELCVRHAASLPCRVLEHCRTSCTLMSEGGPAPHRRVRLCASPTSAFSTVHPRPRARARVLQAVRLS